MSEAILEYTIQLMQLKIRLRYLQFMFSKWNEGL